MKASILISMLLLAVTASAEIRRAIPVLPANSVELEPDATPIPSRPWQLPAETDPNYDRFREYMIEQSITQPYLRVYRRGVFCGYGEWIIFHEEPEKYDPLPGDLLV